MFGLRDVRRALPLCRSYSKPRPSAAAEPSAQLPEWQKRDKAHRKRYGNWNPTKRLSRSQMQDIRSLKQQMPHMKTIDFANVFKVSPEAIRRILQSKWTPTEEEETKLAARAQAAKDKSTQRRQQQIDSLKQAHLRMQPVAGMVEDLPPRSPTNSRTGPRTSATRPKPRRHRQKEHNPSQPYVPSVGDVLE